MPRIEELYAYVIADTGPDDEGVPGFLAAGGMMLPLMGADMEIAMLLRPRAQMIATETGKPVRLVRSTGLEVVETVEPEKATPRGSNRIGPPA